MFKVPRLLGSSTKEIGEIFDYYMKEGKLIEMALLLMVAKEHIMVPSTIQSKDGSIANRSMTISHSIKGVIIYLFDDVLIDKGEVSKFVLMCGFNV